MEYERMPDASTDPNKETQTPQVLLVDDTPANLDVLTGLLEPQGYRVLAAPDGEIALRIASRAQPDLILLDVLMPGIDGYETCRRLKAADETRDIPVVFISALEDVENLVQGFNAGGADYVTKPFRAEEVLVRVETLLRVSRLTKQLQTKNDELEQRTTELTATNHRLQEEISLRQRAEVALDAVDKQLSDLSDREAMQWGIEGFTGRSRTLGKTIEEIKRLRNFGSVNVVITGESGTGKELVARSIHFSGARAKGPFVPVNCVAIPHELAESMLFGHLRGAFTGATMDRRGYFEMAHGGTLFLDEIGDMPLPLQAKLLRVLEDGWLTPLGASKPKQVSVRIVAATNADLQAKIADGTFREDLYFRLAQFTVHASPLRERLEDIPLLAAHFVELFAREMGMTAPRIGPDALALLATHRFPGNIRELKNVIERALIESGGKELRAQHLYLGHPRKSGTKPAAGSATGIESGHATADLPLKLEEAETILIKRALEQTGGNIAEAARKLGVNRTRIYRKLGTTASK
jgi:DNA-binding NtrC family response regulator